MSFMSTITEERSDEINNTTDEIEEISEDKEDVSFSSSNSKGSRGLTNTQNLRTFNHSNEYVSDVLVKSNTSFDGSSNRSPNISPSNNIPNGTQLYSSNENTGMTSNITENNFTQSNTSYSSDLGVLTNTKTSPSYTIKETNILTDIPDIGPYRYNSSYVPDENHTKPLKRLDLSNTSTVWADPSLITYGAYMPSDMTCSVIPYTVEQEKLVFETTNSSSSTGGGGGEIDVTDENEEEHDVCREIKKSQSESLTNEWTRLFKKANEIYKRNQIVKFDEPMSTSESNSNNLDYSDYKIDSTMPVGNKNNTSASNLSEYLKDSSNEDFKTHLATGDIRSIISDYISTGNGELLNYSVSSSEKTKLYDVSAYKEEDLDSAKNIINRYLNDTNISVNGTINTITFSSKPNSPSGNTGSCPSSVSPLTTYNQVLNSEFDYSSNSLKVSETISTNIKDPKINDQEITLTSLNDTVAKKHSPKNKIAHGQIYQKNNDSKKRSDRKRMAKNAADVVANSFKRIESMNKQYNQNCKIISDLEEKLANVEKEKLSINCNSPSIAYHSPSTTTNSPSMIDSSPTSSINSPNIKIISPTTTIDIPNTTNNSPKTAINRPTTTINIPTTTINCPTTINSPATTITCNKNKDYTASNKYSSILDLDFEYLEKKIENSSTLPLNPVTYTPPPASTIQVNEVDANKEVISPLNIISSIKKDYSSDTDRKTIKQDCTTKDVQDSSSALKMINVGKEMNIKNKKKESNNHEINDFSLYNKQNEVYNEKNEDNSSNHIKSAPLLGKLSNLIKTDNKNGILLEKNSISSVQTHRTDLTRDINQFRNSKNIDSFHNQFHDKKWNDIKGEQINNDGKIDDLNVKQKTANNDMSCRNNNCHYETQKIGSKQKDNRLSGANVHQDTAKFEHTDLNKEQRIIGLENKWKLIQQKENEKVELKEKVDKKKEAKNLVVWDKNLLEQRKEDEEVSLSELLLSVNTLLSMSSSTGSNSNEEEGQENSPLGTPQNIDTKVDHNTKTYEYTVKKNFSNDYDNTYKSFAKHTVDASKTSTHHDKSIYKNYGIQNDSPSKLELSLDDLDGKLSKDNEDLDMFDFINECNDLVDEGIEIKDKISHTEKVIGNCLDHMEHELRKAFYQQQDEIQKLRDLLKGKELRIRQLEYENSKLNCDNVTLDDIVEGSLQKSNKKKQALTSGMIEYSDHSEDGSSSDPEIIEEKEIQAN